MTIDWSKPVRTVGNKTPVKILSFEGRGKWPVVGYIGEGAVLSFWSLAGEYSATASKIDLENVPEKKVRYINLYECSVGAHDSREQADRYAASNRQACVRVEYEEGQVDL